ncbi:hypothetical protein I2I05_17895 [Hymenobacter sp. BT683]|uniref:Uncharacterized protein n=1 Tax=Hymenobacter jeongseonensis TaxID=2791027 RepID=A0ABS0IMK4_9BACT|nr:DUF6567 family protein [Hymenobacter jeongseonensis]MBF9239269.1 hypothetical protein [Hymenobacter jeongseonensis]
MRQGDEFRELLQADGMLLVEKKYLAFAWRLPTPKPLPLFLHPRLLFFMQKRLYPCLLLAGIALSTQSCAVHSGLITGGANLQTNNFSYVASNVQGTAKTKYIFGIGGLSKSALVAEAKKDLTKNHPLKSGQAYANFILDFRGSYLPIVTGNRCTLTADIVEFSGVLPSGQSAVPSTPNSSSKEKGE